MSDKDQQIKKIIEDQQIPYEGEIVRESGGEEIYLQLKVNQNSDGTKSPTHRQLIKLKNSLLEIGINLNVIPSQVKKDKFEVLLRESLFLTFPDVLRNVFCNIESEDAYVWVETKKQLSEEIDKRIRKATEGHCLLQGLNLKSLSKIGDTKTPNKTAILEVLRKHAPATPSDLSVALVSKGFTVPSVDWLNRRLDSLRKAKNVLCLADKKYVLSIETIAALGTSNRGAKSTDITRLLAIWKRT